MDKTVAFALSGRFVQTTQKNTRTRGHGRTSRQVDEPKSQPASPADTLTRAQRETLTNTTLTQSYRTHASRQRMERRQQHTDTAVDMSTTERTTMSATGVCRAKQLFFLSNGDTVTNRQTDRHSLRTNDRPPSSLHTPRAVTTDDNGDDDD